MKKFPWQAKDELVMYLWRQYLPRYFIQNIQIFATFLGLWLLIFFIWNTFWNFFIWLILSLITFSVLIFSFIFIFWKNTYLVITNKRIIKFVRNWFFKSHIREITIFSLQECIAKYSGFIDRIFWSWNVSFIWKDENIVIHFYWLRHPEELTMYASRLRDFLIENPNYNPKKLEKFMPRRIRKQISAEK